MANVKITELSAIAAADLADGDVLPIVDVGSDSTKKVTIASLTTLGNANDFITYTQLNSNINVVQDNVASISVTTASGTETRLNANLDIVQDNVAAEATAIQARLTTNVAITTAVEARRVANIAGAVSTITTGDLTASRALASDSSGKVAVSAITSTELGHLDGVSSAIQTQINDINTRATANATSSGAADAVEARRVANIAGAVSTITTGDLTASRAVVSDGSGKVAVSPVTSTEIGYLDGVTSAIQTQLDAKGTTTEDTALQARITANAAITTAVEARRAANVTLSTAEDTALQARITANATITTAVEARRVANIAGAVSTITTGDLTASRALASDGSGKVAVSAVTATELGYLDGVSSAIQTQIDSKQATITGAATTIDDADLTASRAIVSDGSGKVAVSAVTATEIGHLDGVSSAIQTQIDAVEARRDANTDSGGNTATAVEARRVANIAGAVSTITTADLTASRAMVSDGSGKVAISVITATELGYLDGVSSAIQTQLDAKAALAGATFTGQVNMSDDLVVTGNLTINGDTTTVSTTNLDVADRMIMLADGVSGSPSADVGLLFNRGNQGNAAIFYDESAKTFKLSDTKDPKSNTSLSPVTASNLSVGIVDAATLKYDGLSVHTSIADNASVAAAASAAVEARRVANIAGAVSTITTGNLTASRAMATDASGKVGATSITTAELNRLNGVTGDIQTALDNKQATITGAATTIDDADLTASRALASDGSGKVAVSAVTATELGYLDGVSSAIQTQLNSKQATITGAATTIDDTNLTASRAVVSDGSGKVAVSAVTSTEIGYLDGVSSAIQTQIDSKQATITGAATTIDDTNLTASRAVVSDGSGKVAVSAVTATEIGYLDGVSSAIQTQLDAKGTTTEASAIEARRVANIAGAVSTITTGDLTASRAVVSDGSGKVAVSAVTATEVGYLDGVSSAIQTQLDAKSTTANAAQLATGIAAAGGGSMSDFSLEDGDGTSVEMGDSQRVKFIEGGGVDINFTDVSPGSVADPYDLTFTVASSVVAGAGLTGGGVLSADRTLTVGAGTGVTVNADDIAIGQDVATSASPTFLGATVTSNITIGTNASNTVTIVGILDCGAFS